MANQPTTAFPKQAMDAVATGFQGRMGFYVEDLKTGAVHTHNEDKRFPTASVIKIAVMLELYRQVKGGMLSLDDRHRLTGDIATHGSGTLQLMHDEPELTLRDYCRMMITISDNMATDFLMGIVGIPNINSNLDDLGYPNTRASVTMGRYHYRMKHLDDMSTNRANDILQKENPDRYPMDYGSISFSDSLQNNVATPADMASILRRLHDGEIVSPSASAGMVKMLKLCNDQRMIRRYVPREMEVAHKSGSSGRIKGNVGVIYLPSGPLIVSSFALANADGIPGDEAIAEISKLAVSAFSPESVIEE